MLYPYYFFFFSTTPVGWLDFVIMRVFFFSLGRIRECFLTGRLLTCCLIIELQHKLVDIEDLYFSPHIFIDIQLFSVTECAINKSELAWYFSPLLRCLMFFLRYMNNFYCIIMCITYSLQMLVKLVWSFDVES